MIRPAMERDISAMLAIYGPYVENTTVSFEYDVPCQKTFLQRFYTYTAQFPWLVWEENGEILGYAYGSAPFERAASRWCAEMTVYLKPEARGKGIGGKLYAALESILAKQGYQVLYALICDENADSLRFHQKQGYRVVGEFPNCGCKFGRWFGLVWMEKRTKAVEIPSSFPKPWLSIVQDAERFTSFLDSLSLS